MRVYLLLIFLTVGKAWAHPTYVRVGYTSCTGCHVSAQGGGLLTPYGQGIASAQAFFDSEPEEDEEERRYVQAFQGRIMHYRTKDDSRTFPMQMDYLAQFKVSDKIWFEGTLAVAPKPKDESPDDEKSPYQRIYARTLGTNWTIRAQGYSEERLWLGLSALPMGLGLVDHTAYVRSENRQYVTDLPINLKYYFAREKIFGHTFAYIHNPQEEKGNEENGVGTQWWWRPIRNLAFGVQGLQGETDNIKRRQSGLLLKAGLGKWSYLAELDRTWRQLKQDGSEFRQWSWFQQLSFYPWEHLQVYASLQGFERDRTFGTRERREGLGFDWRIFPQLSLSYESRTRIAGSIREYSQLIQLYLNWW